MRGAVLGWLTSMDDALLVQRGHLFPWTPVFLAAGIGTWFLLRFEPGWTLYAAVALVGVTAACLAMVRPQGWSAVAWAAALVAAGFCLAGYRAVSVAAPILDGRYYGPVEGRIVAIDRSASDALRITLDRVTLRNILPHARPERVRISLHGPACPVTPGERVMTTAYLSPPQGPAEPGGFDFRRHAWFQAIGAVGYTRVDLLTVAPPGAGLKVFSVRMVISHHIRSVLSGDTGGFAAAVTTGDRSGVRADTLEALRISNLAHLLAISGLHMGLLTGFVFALIRAGIALIPWLAIRLPGREISAIGAMAAAVIYLALSGGNVATERAFVMAMVVLTALLLRRRALSLRAVALAALIVLLLRPESLLSPGFQMSFAATTALIAVFGALRGVKFKHVPTWVKPVMGVVLSSAVAGAATAPIGAAHFNTLSHYGLLANLLSVPVMGTLVVPAAVLAALLAPFGAEMAGLALMRIGLDWILWVAHWVADMPGSQSAVLAPGPWVLPVLSFGLLWLILWQGRARAVGVGVAAIAMLLWAGSERPELLIAEGGALVGVMTEQGRALSKSRGAGFVARIWLENDGDPVDQPDAAARWPDTQQPFRVYLAAGQEIVHLLGKRGARAWSDCRQGQIIVASVPVSIRGDCKVFDPETMKLTGSLASGRNGFVSARDASGRRLWNTPRPVSGQ